MESPIIITKVNKPDENSHNTYDYFLMGCAKSNFASPIIDKERYLWRWALKGKDSTPEQWFIDWLEVLSKSKEREVFFNDFGLKFSELFYIDGDDSLVYPFKD